MYSQNLSFLSHYIFLEFLTWLVALPSFAGKNSTCTVYKLLYVVLHDGKVAMTVMLMILISFYFSFCSYNLPFNNINKNNKLLEILVVLTDVHYNIIQIIQFPLKVFLEKASGFFLLCTEDTWV